MKNVYKKSRLAVSAITICIFIIYFLPVTSLRAQEKNLMVIANHTGAPESLKLAELKSVMMGEKDRWKSGSRIHIALLKTNTMLGKQIAEKVFDMSPDELNRYWLGLVFQGKAQAPNFFSTVSELENYVSQNPGAIGISNKPPSSEEIREILVDGQKHLP